MLIKKFFKTKNEAEVTFSFSREDAQSVSLYADFTDWQPMPMKLNKKEKSFKAKVRLPKDGVFHFRYLINEKEWDNDHDADLYIANDYGTENSVVSTQA